MIKTSMYLLQRDASFATASRRSVGPYVRLSVGDVEVLHE